MSARGVIGGRAPWRWMLLGVALLASACQQKMAHQPYYRPYEQSEFFPDGRSARPLEPGVIARDQELDDSPLVTGLTPQARAVRPPRKEAEPFMGEPKPEVGAPDNPANYVNGFPFPISAADLRRGQQRFTIYCTPCHGALGNGSGKIVERGFLRPPSFHTTKLQPNEPDETPGPDLNGHSRGFFRFGIKIPLREVPVGYFYEVMSRGYGGMPDYSTQIPPADRWRIAAYVRTLQLSQAAPAKDLPPEDQKALAEVKGKK
jgi:mono/diheme cytochrome c family protein